ncbi:MAG: BLUF domain-containing protein [Bacteroidota bacterium]
MLSQIIYTSTRTKDCTPEEIDKILEACQRNNSHLDITGLLLYNQDKFVQCMEGDYGKIKTLYDKIKEDDRHEKVALISYGPIKKRSFPSWQMARKDMTESEATFRTSISAEDQKVFDGILNGEEQDASVSLDLLKKIFF